MAEQEKASIQMPRFTVTLTNEKPFEVSIPNGVQAQWELERVRKDYPTTEEAPTFWATWSCWMAAKKDPAIKAVPSSMPLEAFMDAVELLEFDEPVTVDPPQADQGSA